MSRINVKLIGSRINQTISILEKENLPYAFDEVSEVVHSLDCDMDRIKEFITGYKASLTTK